MPRDGTADEPDEETQLLGRSSGAGLRGAAQRQVYLQWVVGLAVCALIGVIALSTTAARNRTMQEQPIQQFSALTDDDKWKLFEEYKETFNRQYSSEEEEQQRFAHFTDFLRMVDDRNERQLLRGGDAVHGLTKFADLAPEERTQLRGFIRHDHGAREDATYLSSNDNDLTALGISSIDWTGVYTTEVKNQGYCGSCWAFSAAEQIESDSIRLLGWDKDKKLSTQQVVSCDASSWGCDGGDPILAYTYVSDAGGVEDEAEYPYTSFWGDTGKCDADKEEFKVTVDNYFLFEGSTNSSIEEDMMKYTLSTGPISVCLDASTWDSYTSGVLRTCGDDVDHCVQIVGLDLDGDDSGVWKVRNSWGTDWGVDGYIYLEAGVNLCYITCEATTTAPSLV